MEKRLKFLFDLGFRHVELDHKEEVNSQGETVEERTNHSKHEEKSLYITRHIISNRAPNSVRCPQALAGKKGFEKWTGQCQIYSLQRLDDSKHLKASG